MKWDAGMYDMTHRPQLDAGLKLIALADVKETDHVLDIGCGTGSLTGRIAGIAQRGLVVGIDPSDEMLELAKKASAHSENVILFRMAAENMTFCNEFDIVYSSSAFQWIKRQEFVVSRAYEALRSNGRIAIQLPAMDFCWPLTENIHSAISFLELESVFDDMESPWRFPLDTELRAALKGAGFKNPKTFYEEDMLSFESINDLLSWADSAMLRPYLERLNRKMQDRFRYSFAMGFENYRIGRCIELPFRRLYATGMK